MTPETIDLPADPAPELVDPKVDPIGGIETIDGHLYYIERDEKGAIRRQESRDPVVVTVVVATSAPERLAVLAALDKPPAAVTGAELAAMVQFLCRKQLTG